MWIEGQYHTATAFHKTHSVLWKEGPVRCWYCLHRWVAVRPVDTVALECPKCGRPTPTEEG